jgi:hypothetical protein
MFHLSLLLLAAAQVTSAAFSHTANACLVDYGVGDTHTCDNAKKSKKIDFLLEKSDFSSFSDAQTGQVCVLVAARRRPRL